MNISSLTNFIFHSGFDQKNARLFSNIIILFALINILAVLPDIFVIYSKYGFFNEDLIKHIDSNNAILLYDLTSILGNFGLQYHYAFILIFVAYIFSILLVLLNYFRIFFSIVIVFLHTSFMNSTDLLCYGADFMVCFLLYINVFLSLEQYVTKEVFSSIFSFTIRLMQIQLCVIYFFGGFGKALGYDWYTGDAVWLSLNLYMNNYVLDVIAPYTPKFLYQFLSLHILLIEIFYPILVYFKKTKKWVILVNSQQKVDIRN